MAEASTAVAKRKLRPARKQVKAGDVDLSEKVQAGKEYSEFMSRLNEIVPSHDVCVPWI